MYVVREPLLTLVIVVAVTVGASERDVVVMADLKSDSAVPMSVSATLRLKGRLDDSHLKPEPPHHIVEHAINLISDPAFAQLYLHVTITEVIRDPSLVEPARQDVRDSFRESLDPIDAPVGALEVIASFEAGPALDEDPDLLAGNGVRALAHALPVIE